MNVKTLEEKNQVGIDDEWCSEHLNEHCQVTPVLGVSDQCYDASMEYIHGKIHICC